MQLVLEVLSKCEGAYGLLIKSAYYPGELVACKRGSPLLLGVRTAARTPHASPKRPVATADGAFEAFIASDASAFVEHTNQCAPCCTPAAPKWGILPHLSAVTGQPQHLQSAQHAHNACCMQLTSHTIRLH